MLAAVLRTRTVLILHSLIRTLTAHTCTVKLSIAPLKFAYDGIFLLESTLFMGKVLFYKLKNCLLLQNFRKIVVNGKIISHPPQFIQFVSFLPTCCVSHSTTVDYQDWLPELTKRLRCMTSTENIPYQKSRGHQIQNIYNLPSWGADLEI